MFQQRLRRHHTRREVRKVYSAHGEVRKVRGVCGEVRKVHGAPSGVRKEGARYKVHGREAGRCRTWG